MKTLDLPHGPWKALLTGTWSDREISYHENPDKELLVMIYDRRGEDIRGMVFFMVKLFTLDGNMGTFADNAGENTILVHKHTPTYKGTFLAVTTSPEYVKFSPRELIDAADKHYDELEQRAAEARKKSGDYSVKLIEARYSQVKDTNELFGEPLAIPAIVVRKEGPGLVSTQQTGRLHLGITLDNKKAEEPIKSFILTVLHGKDTARAMQVIMEGCVMSGVSGVVFEGFDKVEAPATNTDDYGKYMVEADPMGMPVRRFKPGADYFIPLKILNKELFGDITGAGHGKEVELIGRALEKAPENLNAVIASMLQVKEEESRYFAARAVRLCRLLQLAYPGLFDGTLEPKEIVAPWLKRMGRVAIVNTEGVSAPIRKGLVYAALRTLYDSYKKEFAGGEIKVVVVVSEPELYGRGQSSIDHEANTLIKMANEYGVGVCIRAESEMDIDPDIRLNSTITIQELESHGASVREHSKNPYRISLRPTLSAE